MLLEKLSGAHINPAITIGFSFAGHFDKKEVFPYILSQLLGAISASFLLRLLFSNQELFGNTFPSDEWIQTFILEFLMTCILMIIILKVSSVIKRNRNNGSNSYWRDYFCIEALVFGPITGASMNPARSIAPALASGNFTHLWIYIVAAILGALLGVLIFSLIGNKKRG